MPAIKGKIVIVFNLDPLNGQTLSFNRTHPTANQGSPASVPLPSTFVDGSRTKNGEVELPTPTATAGESAAMSYEKVFNIDHNPSGILSISRAINVITIEIDEGWDFGNFITDTGATETISAAVGPTFILDFATLQANPTEPCDFVDVEVTMSTQAENYALNNNIFPVISNPFTASIQRTVPTRFLAIKLGNDTINIGLDKYGFDKFYFQKLYDENVAIAVIPNIFTGATVSILVNYNNQLSAKPDIDVLEYSLDGVAYSTDHIFTGQLDGDYTAYIRDSFGCIFTKDFTVSSSGARDPFFFISNVNSITFSEDEVWDGLQGGIHKNEENLLSLTETNQTLFDERVIVRDSDNVRVQFKSNYETHNVTLQGCDGEEITSSIVVEKMSNNLDLFEGLDATLYNLENNQAGVFFTSGFVYASTDAIIGTYELNGNLPDSAIIGVFFELVGFGVHEVADIIYDKDRDKKVMVFDFAYTDDDVAIRTKANYDLLNFEVYEFDVDFNLIPTPLDEFVDMRIRIQVTDTLYDERNFYTEYIRMFIEYYQGLNKYIAINYYNENNRDIFYLYGITHFMRAEVLRTNTIIEDEAEIIKGDESVYMSDSSVYSGMAIFFAEVTHRVMLKLVLALSSENLFINGLGYVKNGSVSVTAVDNTNLYEVSVDLLRTDKNFNTITESDTGLSEGYKTAFIPKIINSGVGLLKT